MKTRLADLDARCTQQACTHNGDYQLTGHCHHCQADVAAVFTRGHHANNGVLGPNCPVCGRRQLYWGGTAA